MILFQWMGFAPKESCPDHRSQASCAAAFPSKAAFLRAVGSTRSRLPYVSCSEIREDGVEHANEGARIAIANPGVVYWHDNLNHPHKDALWLVHSRPEYA